MVRMLCSLSSLEFRMSLKASANIAGLFYHWYLPRYVTGVDRSSEADEPGSVSAA